MPVSCGDSSETCTAPTCRHQGAAAEWAVSADSGLPAPPGKPVAGEVVVLPPENPPPLARSSTIHRGAHRLPLNLRKPIINK